MASGIGGRIGVGFRVWQWFRLDVEAVQAAVIAAVEIEVDSQLHVACTVAVFYFERSPAMSTASLQCVEMYRASASYERDLAVGNDGSSRQCLTSPCGVVSYSLVSSGQRLALQLPRCASAWLAAHGRTVDAHPMRAWVRFSSNLHATTSVVAWPGQQTAAVRLALAEPFSGSRRGT